MKRRLGRKKIIVLVATLAILIAIVGGVIYFVRKQADKSTDPSLIVPSEPKIESDVTLLSINEFKQKYTDPVELKNELILAGYNKESFGKYDEALKYYEEALNVVSGDEPKTQEVQYIIYLFAERSLNQSLQADYRVKLGETYILQRKKEALDAENNL